MLIEVLERPLAPLLRDALRAHGDARNGTPRPEAPAHGAPPTHTHAVASLEQVEKVYRLGETEVHALRGIDITIHAGELLAVCGPSGSGKTTLLNLVGLIDRPTRGRVCLQGEAVDKLGEGRRTELRNGAIGFIFQSFNLVPVLSALENVLLPLQIRGRVGAAQRRKALDLLDEVGLTAQAKARPDQMSGGQRQRVAIARALVTDPRLVIADEPTANLDTENSLRVMSVIHTLNREHHVTFAFSTHDTRVLERVTRRIELRDGMIHNPET